MDSNKIVLAPELKDNILIIREGSASEIREFKPASFAGSITAPADWIIGKKAAGFEILEKHSTIVVNKHMGKIFAHINEFVDKECSGISGELMVNPDLKAFFINSTKKWTNHELRSFLKMNRYFFEDQNENFQVVDAFEKFKIKITTEIEQHDDLKGNKKNLFERKVKSELKLSFSLNIPIFTGSDSISFEVDINFDIKNAEASFWLESAQLRELKLQQKEDILETEIKRLSGFPIIYT